MRPIQKIKERLIIADIAMDFLPEVETAAQWEIIKRYQQAGFTYLNIAVGGDLTSVENAIRYLARQRTHIREQADQLVLVETVDDIRRAKQENKLALGLWFQGAAPLAKDIHLIELYYTLGIRHILVTYNTRNEIGDGILEKPDAGLSLFGRRVIEEMNRVGLLIDLSHAGIKTSLDIMEVSKDPVIFSHSNASGVHAHVRNLTDEQIRAVAKKGGVIGISGMGLLLGEEKPTAKKWVSHIDYINQLVGSADHVAIGLDLVHFKEMLPVFFEKSGLSYPKGYLGSMEGLQPEQIDEIIEALLCEGYAEDQIEKIMGGNYLRVISRVWK